LAWIPGWSIFPTAAAIPPWAREVFVSNAFPLVSTTIRASGFEEASPSAIDKPAIPLPTTTVDAGDRLAFVTEQEARDEIEALLLGAE
jgi:hypothetical protein